MTNEPKIRYSDTELEEFRLLIEQKIATAKEDLEFNQQQIRELNESGFNQQGGDLYEDTSLHGDLDMLNRYVVREQLLIQNLQNALQRIKNKTYGICVVTGNLIDKKRLFAVPHATKSVEGKLEQDRKEEAPVNTTNGYNPIEEEAKVRMSDKKPVKKKASEFDEDGAPTDDSRQYARSFDDGD